jgi:subtilisin family serine protease
VSTLLSSKSIHAKILCLGGYKRLLPQHGAGQGVKIAVLDTGIAPHPDLQIAGGKSFIANSESYADDHGHGTHVAGTISALDNKSGVIGVAPKAQLYALKVLDHQGSGSYSQIIEAIQWSIANKMDILSMSFGGKSASQALHQAIKEASAEELS